MVYAIGKKTKGKTKEVIVIFVIGSRSLMGKSKQLNSKCVYESVCGSEVNAQGKRG
jgi:hypothetical protein